MTIEEWEELIRLCEEAAEVSVHRIIFRQAAIAARLHIEEVWQ